MSTEQDKWARYYSREEAGTPKEPSAAVPRQSKPRYFNIQSLTLSQELGPVKVVFATNGVETTLFLPKGQVPTEALTNPKDYRLARRRTDQTFLYRIEEIPQNTH